jgi:hypothetical protein
MDRNLQRLGVGVCGTEFGRQLGGGLFEFRLRTESLGEGAEKKPVLRVFCHAYGRKVVLLVGGYDKGEDPSPRRQQAEIGVARWRLADWTARRGAFDGL